MIPALRERAAAQALNRRALPETIAEMKNAGFFRILQPKRWGGYELSPRVFADVQMALAEGDPATSWVFGILAIHNYHMGFMDDRVAEEVWGADDATLVGSPYAPGGVAKTVEGGFRFSGRWKFSSGSEYCQWTFLGGLVDPQASDKSFLEQDFRAFLLPRQDYEIVDTWDVIGLKGTGSQDIVVKDAFVPEYRALRHPVSDWRDTPGAKVNTGILFRMPFFPVFERSVSTTAIGALQGMLDEFQAYGVGRRTLFGMAMPKDPDAQLAAAEAANGIDEMKTIMYRNFSQMEEIAERGDQLSQTDLARFSYQSAVVPQRCSQLALAMLETVGGSGLYNTHVFGRYYTDLLMAARHAANSWKVRGREWGAVLLGGV
jgi:3-hydroxy-9,10-secoandrosta-1,3,5(10)-triene-9,17-dione monooxygenase